MKLLYHGRMWKGSTALQKFEAFRRQPGVTAITHDAGTLSAPFLDGHRIKTGRTTD